MTAVTWSTDLHSYMNSLKKLQPGDIQQFLKNSHLSLAEKQAAANVMSIDQEINGGTRWV